ncbi:MAG: CvpA family protein, partial [Planctomycetota bacterium]|nr:CvpA family protein [Planctomycetota bacterium]
PGGGGRMLWDIAIFTVTSCAAMWGLKRGFVRQCGAMLATIAGVALAAWGAPGLAWMFAPLTADPAGACVAAFFLILGLIGLCINLLTTLLLCYMEIRDLKPYDAVLGGGLGAARGVLLVAVALGAAARLGYDIPGIGNSLFAWRVAEAGEEAIPAWRIPEVAASINMEAARLGGSLGIRVQEEVATPRKPGRNSGRQDRPGTAGRAKPGKESDAGRAARQTAVSKDLSENLERRAKGSKQIPSPAGGSGTDSVSDPPQALYRGGEASGGY